MAPGALFTFLNFRFTDMPHLPSFLPDDLQHPGGQEASKLASGL
jgi:hypothetical protein